MKEFEDYLKYNQYSSSTINRHLKNIERFRKWTDSENVELMDITYQDLLAYMKYLSKRGTGKNTIRCYLNSIKHYYSNLVKQNIINKNPANNLQIKGIKRKMVYDVLSPIELEQLYHKFTTTPPVYTKQHESGLRALEYQRDIVMLGLLIYQGVTAKELIQLQPNHIRLRQGQIEIPGGRKSESRVLKLEAVQMLDIQEYLLKTRAEILQATNKASEQLFISIGWSESLYPTLGKFTNTIRKQNPRIQDLQQVRASVIVKWLKNYNLRQVQYMAGHRYVSSTEKYKLNDLRDLQEDINKYHPTITG
jgi:integrase/recombinase XerD